MGESQERGKALEREVETLIAGVLTPGSGNQQIKGDALSTCFHVEAKYRSNWPATDAMPLDIEWLETIWNQKGARIPVLALEWESGRRLLLLPLSQWVAITGEAGTPLPDERSGRRFPFHWPEISPWQLRFPALKGAEPDWIGLHWAAFADLRRGAQPRKESASFRRTDSGFRARPSTWSKRGFRQRS